MYSRGLIALTFFAAVSASIFGQAEDLSDLGIRSWNLKNIYTTTLLPVGDITIPIRHKKPKEAGAVTLFMDGIRGKVDFSPNNKKFQPGLHIPMKADPSRGVLLTSEDDLYQILRAEVENAPNCDQIIIAHSQGGQRAIAYANIMNQLGLADRIKGIIFIGSPVKGWYTLSHSDGILGPHNPDLDVTDPYALNAFKASLNNTISTAANLGQYVKYYFGKLSSDIGPAVDGFLEVIQSGTLNDLLGATDSALTNLGPKSLFAKHLLGIDYVTPYRGFLFGGYYETDRSHYRQVLPPHIKVGFVVGTDNGIWDMVADSNQRYWLHYLLDDVWAKGQPGYIGDLYKFIFDGANNSITKAKHDYSAGWIDGAKRDEIIRMNEYALKFCDWVDNYRHYGLASILKSYTNDGVVATFSQSRTIEQIGGAQIASNYIFNVHAVHAGNYDQLSEIGSVAEIWSSGKWRDSQIFTGAGIVSQWYSENESNAPTAEERNSWKTARLNWVAYF